MTKIKLLGILSIGVILALSAIVYVGYGSVAAASLKPHDSSTARCNDAAEQCHGVGKPDVVICEETGNPSDPTEAFVFFDDADNDNVHNHDTEKLQLFPKPCGS